MTDQDQRNLAQAAGLALTWVDFAGRHHEVGLETLRAALAALGLPVTDADSFAASRELLAETSRAQLRPLLVTPAGAPLSLPPGTNPSVADETGQPHHLAILERTGDGLVLAAPYQPGFYRIELPDGPRRLAVCPGRALTVADLAGREGRLAALAVQLPSLRGGASAGFGDFAALADLAEQVAREGIHALAISPTHALFPADPHRFSPYAPSTRLFLNPLLADAGAPAAAPPALDDSADLIDWPQAAAGKWAQLAAAYARLGTGTEAAAFEAWRRAAGPRLEEHVLFEALDEHFHARNLYDWRSWPAPYRDAASPEVQAFATEAAQRMRFFAFCQWRADASLAEAQRRARAAGMAVGLITDLAVGMDGRGSHAWSRPREVLTGLHVGAPPDAFNRNGQDWGLTALAPTALLQSGFASFIATLETAMRHAGGVRIDHAMGLERLWVIPAGAPAGEGVYLHYPRADMLGLIGLLSNRHRAIVIGEDLGTVQPSFRAALDQTHIYGMRVLFFSRDRDRRFAPPASYDRDAAALTATHDLPTVAGWWQGHDLAWSRRLRPRGPEQDDALDEWVRGEDRTRLWQALTEAGAAEGAQPAPDAPDAAVDGAIAFIADTPARLAIVPVEDIMGLIEQPNLPGTTDQHPNWRRRLPVAAIAADPRAALRLRRLTRDRRPQPPAGLA